MSVVEPISDSDLDPVCAFWRSNFKSRCPQEVWVRAFRRNWYPDKPNNGFLLRDGEKIVGALGAIYSQQVIQNKKELFCNMTSWCVLDQYRNRSMELFLSLVRQKGFHFTNFSATPTVAKILPSAGFKALSSTLTAVPNIALPWMRSGRVVLLNEPEAIAQVLPSGRQKICLDHADCPGVRQLAVGTPDTGYCHILFGRGICRGLSCALVYDINDPSLLRQFWHHFAGYMLYQAGGLVTRINSRILGGERLPYAIDLSNSFTAFFLSSTLKGDVIRPIYSEVVALQGC